MKKFRKSLASMLLALLPILLLQAQEVNLAGPWSFQMDRLDVGIQEAWFNKPLDETIHLPGSMPEYDKGDIPGLETQWTGSLYDSSFYFNPAMARYRQPGRVKFPFFLTPDRHYVGAAWYQRDVVIPENWRGQRIVLTLERPHIETMVWLDNQLIGKDSSFCVPHCIELPTTVKPGTHRLTLRIDNRIKSANVGQDSHSLTDQTQGNWNGVVGTMTLASTPLIFLEDIQVYPDLSKREARLAIRLENRSGKTMKRLLRWQARSYNSPTSHETDRYSYAVTVPDTGLTVQLTLPLGDAMQTWDEFNPALYRLSVELLAGTTTQQTKSLSFGMREIVCKGKWFYLNGRKIQLRGTVENCCFPKTGYAPMDVAAWERIFRICKRFGLNHMRFHSWCPPEAAFEAADLVGMYLQPEGPSWPNHGSSLGDGKPIDRFLMEETKRLSKAYGNHPSFVMLAAGNEPRGRWVAWVTRFVNEWKASDSRRVYTGASVGGSWAWQPANQFHVKAGARGLAWNRKPESRSDFKPSIDTVSVPFVSHETGQWCAFPNFSEIRKYTGVNKARNFELFQEELALHDMGDQAAAFLMASGHLQTLCYKHEIEKTLRTPDYAGFQLLSLNDYSGQGTALVGVLDVFWEEKGYCRAEDFSRFCGPVVPLIRTSSFVLTNDQPLNAAAELSYFAAPTYAVVQPSWKLTNEGGVVVAAGTLPERPVEPGNNISLGDLNIDLSFVKTPQRLTLTVTIAPFNASNDWDFHVYPATVAIPEPGDVLVDHSWSPAVAQRLAEGGKVLLLCDGRVEYGKDIVNTLAPVFWNTSWFKMRPPHTTGMLINDHHPVFRDFPTRSHVDLSWWELVQGAQVMQLTDFPAGFRPIVQPIDTWFLSRKIGLLFEAKVGTGRLMVCSMDLERNLDSRPVARQLYLSLMNYLQSNRFKPAFTVEAKVVEDLFLKAGQRSNTFTSDAPDELKNLVH
jgi:hypothetical protein